MNKNGILKGIDEAATAWFEGVAKEWAEELCDSRQDIYTLDDGQPVTTFHRTFPPQITGVSSDRKHRS